MKSIVLSLLSFFFPIASNARPESVEYRRAVLSAMSYDSARASLILEEFNGRGY